MPLNLEMAVHLISTEKSKVVGNKEMRMNIKVSQKGEGTISTAENKERS